MDSFDIISVTENNYLIALRQDTPISLTLDSFLTFLDQNILLKNKDASICLTILPPKPSKIKTDILYFRVNVRNIFFGKPSERKAVFKLFTSIDSAFSENEEECLQLEIYPQNTSILHWITTHCPLFHKFELKDDYKKSDFLISIVDQLNIYFNVKKCFTSDEAQIKCDNNEDMDLSLTQLFKYGRTYYEKFDFIFDLSLYSEKTGSESIIREMSDYLKAKKIIQNSPLTSLPPEIQHILKTDESTKIDYNSSTTLGQFMSKILQKNCYTYIDLLEYLLKEYSELRQSITIMNHAKLAYVKNY